MSKFLDETGLDKLIQLIKSALGNKVDTVSGKGLSTNDYTTTEKEKLAGIDTGAEENVIESISVNGTAQTITNKGVDIAVPVSTSDLTNDSGFITDADIPEGAAASTTAPLMDGTASAGSSNAFARGDHVHPVDSTRAPLDSPALTGTPTAPTAAAGTNSTQVATTAFVKDAIDTAVAGVYVPKGTIAFANLPTAGAGNIGWVYNISDAFTTTAAFVEGAGGKYTAGTNVVCVSTGTNTYAWDVLGGTFDIEGMTATEVQTLWDSN